MDNELIFRQAQSCETDRIMQIIRQAQARMHAAGSRQWQDGYPAPGHISADIGRNRGYEFLHRVETLAQERGVKAFRIDTNFDNQTMLRLLERTGFTYCGKVVYRSGERLAYEKRI